MGIINDRAFNNIFKAGGKNIRFNLRLYDRKGVNVRTKTCPTKHFAWVSGEAYKRIKPGFTYKIEVVKE